MTSQFTTTDFMTANSKPDNEMSKEAAYALITFLVKRGIIVAVGSRKGAGRGKGETIYEGELEAIYPALRELTFPTIP